VLRVVDQEVHQLKEVQLLLPGRVQVVHQLRVAQAQHLEKDPGRDKHLLMGVQLQRQGKAQEVLQLKEVDLLKVVAAVPALQALMVEVLVLLDQVQALLQLKVVAQLRVVEVAVVQHKPVVEMVDRQDQVHQFLLADVKLDVRKNAILALV